MIRLSFALLAILVTAAQAAPTPTPTPSPSPTPSGDVINYAPATTAPARGIVVAADSQRRDIAPTQGTTADRLEQQARDARNRK